MRFRGQSVLRVTWKRRVGDPEVFDQFDRVGPLLTPWKPIHHTARSREMAKEGAQVDIKVASTETHPLKDQIDYVPPRLDRSSPTLRPSVVIRREERVRACFIFGDPQAVG